MAKCGPKGPSKYTPAVLDNFAGQIEQRAKDYRLSEMMFLISEVALDLDFLPDYFDDFSKLNEGFSLALKKLKAVQEINYHKSLVKCGSNTGGIIFAMKNACKWRDVQELTGKDGKDLVPDYPRKEMLEILVGVAEFRAKRKKKK